ncbi:MAG: response regulator [Polyangiaceae bacterium]|nr:response regulator [Polyangiaceae bacterium]
MAINPIRVLVVDDDDIVRQTMADDLTEAGCWVESLPTPIGATKAIVQNAIDVVVIDVLMPSMRGDKLAALLRSNPKVGNLSVILISGDAAELGQLGDVVKADALVEKCDLDRLPKIVRQVFEKRRSRAPVAAVA